MNGGQRRLLRSALGVLALSAALAGAADAQPLAPTADAAPLKSATATGGLGRLFFRPEQRQELDRRRQFKLPESNEAASEPTFTIDGVVTRSSGKRTVWINGVAQNDDERGSGVAVSTSRARPGRVVVRPADAPATHAPVGATVQRGSGETTDLLGGGRITTHPAAGRSRWPASTGCPGASAAPPCWR